MDQIIASAPAARHAVEAQRDRALQNVDEMIRLGNVPAECTSAGMSRDEMAAIYLYTGEWNPTNCSIYRLLNAALASRSPETVDPYEPYKDLLLQAMSKMRKGEPVFRAVSGDWSKEYEDAAAANLSVEWPRFSSCSFTQAKALEFIDDHNVATIFTITLTTSRGRNIKTLSFHMNEDEVLLPPNLLFGVRGVGRLDRFVFVQLAEIVPTAPSQTSFGGRSYTALFGRPDDAFGAAENARL